MGGNVIAVMYFRTLFEHRYVNIPKSIERSSMSKEGVDGTKVSIDELRIIFEEEKHSLTSYVF